MSTTGSNQKITLTGTGNRGQAVYEALRTALLDGQLKPGDPLREEQVAAWFKVSRTPVREAFARLLGRSLLEHAGGRGLVVRRLRTSEVYELYAMREVLEGAAAGFAATHASPLEIDTLVRLQREFAAVEPGSGALVAARINQRFHTTIHVSARNRYLDFAFDDLADGIALLGPTTLANADRHKHAIDEHETLLDAIRRRDAPGAERVAREHIRAALQARESGLETETSVLFGAVEVQDP